MKPLAAFVCIVSLLIPALAQADRPDPAASLARMFMEDTIDRDELHAALAAMLRGAGVTILPTEEMTAQANIMSYVCSYIAFTAIIDFIDCLVYYDIMYDCRSAIINGLLFYYFC